MEKFTVNGKTYVVSKELDFSFMVMLDKNDIKPTNMAGFAAANCFLAFVSGMTEGQASDEITEHIKNGGNLDDILGAYAKALESSGFFRALMEQAEKGQKEVGETDEKTSPRKRTAKAATE